MIFFPAPHVYFFISRVHVHLGVAELRAEHALDSDNRQMFGTEHNL